MCLAWGPVPESSPVGSAKLVPLLKMRFKCFMCNPMAKSQGSFLRL